MNAGFQLNAFDPNSLGDLKRLARSEGQQDVALRAAAKQFEALFLQMVMKSMRDATPACDSTFCSRTPSASGSETEKAISRCPHRTTAADPGRGRR